MAGHNQTQLVVNYPNPTTKASLETGFQNRIPKPRPQVRGTFKRKCGSQDDTNFWNVKNPWLLRIAAVFSLAITIVIFAALHSKLRSSFYDLSIEVRQLHVLISTFKDQISLLEHSVQCAYSVNGTDAKGRRCLKYRFQKGRKHPKGTKTPPSESLGKKDPKDSSDQAGQRRKQGITKRKMSRRSTVFTRWGTTQCRTSNKSHTSLVYSGRVAAAHSKNKGGGSNYLCLPDRAFYTNPGNISEDQSSHLYPVKYGRVSNIFNKFLPDLLKGLPEELRKKMTANLNYEDVPCAVCRVDGATAVLTVPAHNICPRRWDRQYHGYLMSQKHDSVKSEFVCVDVEAHGIANTYNPKGNSFLHLTEFKCGTPTCSGYEQHKALSCTVCTV